MRLALGVVADEQVRAASQRALQGSLPLRLIDAAAELPGGVTTHRPLVVVASPRDKFGDAVIPYMAEVRELMPQIGVVLISDGAATIQDRVLNLSLLGEIRSVKAGSREYAANLHGAVEDQAERYRTEYIVRAFASHTPSNLLPLLHYCARTWGEKLSANDAADALRHDRHAITRWVRAAQPSCGLREVLRWHHLLDITWRLWARGEPFKAVALRFKYRRAARLRGKVRHWLDIDVRDHGRAAVQSWEALVDRFADEFAGRRHTDRPDQESQ